MSELPAETRREPLVGRGREQTRLGALLDRVGQGSGGAALVRGEAGMGKTALVDDLGARAEARGLAVARGRAWEFAEAPPYFPLWPCLRSLGIEVGEASVGGFHFWERVVAALASAVARRGVVWIVEDVHAADEQTLELACFLAQAVRALPAALVLTARPRDARLTERGARLLSRVGRDGTLVALEPLPPEHIITVSERAAKAPLRAAEKARIVELAGGNPLFAVECAKALRSATPRALPIPPTVRDVVLELVASLPRRAAEAISAGAVLGRDLSAYLVARMLDRLPARVIDDLGPAVEAGIVHETAPGRFSFAHALTREAIYKSLAPEQRSALHRKAADSLASFDGPSHLIERAHHALAAFGPGDEAEAIDLARRAAALAEAQGAHDRAYALARRAHDVCHPHPSGLGGSAADLTELARLAHRAGLASEVGSLCRAAIDRAERAGDSIGLARAALALGASLTPAVVDKELVRALEAARAALSGTPADLACLLDARLAAALQPASDPEVPIALGRTAVERARALGDRRILHEVLFFAGSAFVDFAPLEERVDLDAQLIESAAAAFDLPRALTGYARLAMDLAERGDIDRLDEELGRMREIALAVGHPRLTWRTSLLGSMIALARGDFGTSERLVVEVEQLAGLADDQALTMSLAAHAQHRARMMHREDLAREALLRIGENMRNVAFGPVIGALVEASNAAWFGDREGARRALSQVSLDVATRGEGFLHRMAAEAVWAAGTPEDARRLLAVTKPALGLMHVGGHVPMSIDGPVARTRGLLHAAAGDPVAAARELERALAICRARGLEPWVERIASELSQVRTSRDLRALPASVDLPKASAERGAAAPRDFAMRRDGDGWSLAFDGRDRRVRDSRGLQLLAELVARPGEEIHVLVLASEGGVILGDSDAGPVLDDRAAQAYRARLHEIALALEACPDDGLQRERDFLEAELSRAFGLRGERRAGSASERARVNVQRRLKDAIRRVGEIDASLGRYLERAVRTGTFCSFRP